MKWKNVQNYWFLPHTQIQIIYPLRLSTLCAFLQKKQKKLRLLLFFLLQFFPPTLISSIDWIFVLEKFRKYVNPLLWGEGGLLFIFKWIIDLSTNTQKHTKKKAFSPHNNSIQYIEIILTFFICGRGLDKIMCYSYSK